METNEAVKKEIPVEPIYSGSLNQEDITETPILQLVAESNETFVDLQKKLQNKQLDYKKFKEGIDKRIEEQPKYLQTGIVSEMKRFINNFEQLSVLLKQRKQIFIKAINQMIDLSKNKK